MPKIIKDILNAIIFGLKKVLSIGKKILTWLNLIKKEIDPEEAKAQEIARIEEVAKLATKGVKRGKKSK